MGGQSVAPGRTTTKGLQTRRSSYARSNLDFPTPRLRACEPLPRKLAAPLAKSKPRLSGARLPSGGELPMSSECRLVGLEKSGTIHFLHGVGSWRAPVTPFSLLANPNPSSAFLQSRKAQWNSFHRVQNQRSALPKSVHTLFLQDSEANVIGHVAPSTPHWQPAMQEPSTLLFARRAAVGVNSILRHLAQIERLSAAT
jgi:hypothetical protein